MIKNYLNTNVLTACEMLDVTDEKILEWSNGEITRNDYLDETVNDYEGSLIDEKIFGKGESLKMGHISLPIPVVNPHFVRGRKPILHTLLGMPREKVEAVVDYYLYYNKDTKEFVKPVDVDRDNEDVYLSGGEAIEYLLKEKNISTSGIILHYFPVIPLSLRASITKSGEIEMLLSINDLYHILVERAERLEKEIKEDMPSLIITKERILLEECAASLILNGVYNPPMTNSVGIPYKSLNDIADSISNPFTKSLPDNLLANIKEEDTEKIGSAMDKWAAANNDVRKWYKDNNMDDEYYLVSELRKNPGFCAIDDRESMSRSNAFVAADEIVSEVFNKYFSNCSDYKEQFEIAARNQVYKFLSNCLYSDNTSKLGALGIYRHVKSVAYINMNCLKSKRIQYIPYDTYEIEEEI